jgi:recombination protein RecA
MGNTDLSSLTNILHDMLNKEHKNKKVAYFLDDDIYTPTDVGNWLHTGSSVLDLAISNIPNGGVPYGRITELQGLEGSGKSLIGAHLLASNQKQGGISIYIDTETSVFRPFLEVIGVDLKKLLYVRLSLVEDIFETIENMIVKVREANKDVKLAILVDSLAGATTKVEQESDFDKDGWSTAKAIITSKAMRKITDMIGSQNIALIFTQQLRVNLGVTFGDKYTTSGGKALGFHSSVRIRLDKSTKIYNKKKDCIGINIKAKIIKNRLGPPLRVATFQVYFDRGIDDYSSWLQALKDRGIISSAGIWYSLPLEDGTVKKFQSKKWGEMLDNKETHDYVYKLLCDTYIMKYKPKEVIDIDEIEISKEEVEE